MAHVSNFECPVCNHKTVLTRIVLSVQRGSSLTAPYNVWHCDSCGVLFDRFLVSDEDKAHQQESKRVEEAESKARIQHLKNTGEWKGEI